MDALTTVAAIAEIHLQYIHIPVVIGICGFACITGLTVFVCLPYLFQCCAYFTSVMFQSTDNPVPYVPWTSVKGYNVYCSAIISNVK